MTDRRRAGAIARARRSAAALTCAATLATPAIGQANEAAEAVRREHERCQQLRTDGKDAEAGVCFEQVFFAVAGIDARASRDLFNVLIDATTAYQRAHAADREPGHLCRAAFLIKDYLQRPQKAEAIRFRRRAIELADRVDAGLDSASRTAGRDVCREPAPAAVEVKEPAEPTEGTPPTPGTSTAPALKRLPTATRTAPYAGRSRWAAPEEPGIELLAAGFAVTLAGAVTAGVGVGLLLYRSECTSATPDCSDAALASYHDAGYLTLAAGAGIIVAGASILFADRILQRKRQASQAPRIGFGGTSVALSGRF